MPATYYDATLNGESASPQDVNVTLGNNFFNPQFITITVGTTVVWTNPVSRNHTVTSDPSSAEIFNSGNMIQNAVFTHTFTLIGTFGYHCQYHGSPGAGMYGTVTVVGSGPTNTPANTNTPLPTSTPTNTPANTNTPPSTNTMTSTPLPTNTSQPTITPTHTPQPTNTSQPTLTPTHTNTPTSTSTPTSTPLVTNTATTTPAPTSTPCMGQRGESQGNLSIIILNGDDNADPPAILQNDLLALSGVTRVDIFNVSSHGGSTPTLAQLQPYNVVVAFSNYPFADPNALGNALADYADGGGVVVALDYTFYDDLGQGTALGGRWAQDGYSPFDAGTLSYPGGTLGTYDHNSPLMQGIATLNADYRTINSVAYQATLVASWNNHGPMMAYKGNVVGITAYLGAMGTWSGDFAQVIVNAGHFLGGSCVTPSPTPTQCAVSGTAGLPHTIGIGNPGQGNLIRLPKAQSDLKFRTSSARLDHVSGVSSWNPDAMLRFILDTGFLDEVVGFNNGTTSYPAIWLNRFTPNPSDYPLHLDTIGIQWPDANMAGTNLVGKTVDLLVYLDTDGNNDPSNAIKIAQIPNQTITVADDINFQYFPVDITVNGPGDLYIGFADTYNSGGHSPVSSPAGLDIDSPQLRSWAAANGATDPNYDNLGGNQMLGTIEQLSGGFTTGNWVVRAIGENVSSCQTTTPTSTPGQPTNTPLPSNTPLPTNTPLLTNTPGGPTSTPISATDTPAATSTPLPVTNTPQPNVTPTDCPNSFVDVQGDIFYLAIHYLNCRGVINGTDATHYTPGGTATRGQFAKIVVLGFGLTPYTPTGGNQDFTDVPSSYFAYTFIETGFHNNILSGFDPATCVAAGATPPCYLPNRPITRGQLTKLVVNAAHYILFTPTGGTQTFSDVPPSNVFYVSIETAANKGVVSGYPDYTFRPNNNIRRDEMAQIVYKGVTTP